MHIRGIFRNIVSVSMLINHSILDDDFANQWLERSRFYTVEPLPSKLRLVEIAKHEIVRLSIV